MDSSFLTFAMIKPEGIERGLVGRVISRIERAEITICSIRTKRFTEQTAALFYVDHKEREYFPRLVGHMVSGLCVGLILRAPNVMREWRDAMGGALREQRGLGTIREQLCRPSDPVHINLVHGSDSIAAFYRETSLFGFQPDEYV